MYYLTTGLRYLVFLLAWLGYCLFFRKKWNIEIAFTPALSCIGIGCVMFAAGLLNIMPYTVPVLFGGGIVALVWACPIRELKNKLFLRREIIIISFYFLGLVYLFLRCRGARLIDFDNFSHWALVVREMLKTNQLPNFESELIQYQGYPTGTAGFIYFVCKIIGVSEGRMIFGNVLLIFSFFWSIFAVVKKVNLFSGIILAGGLGYCFVAGVASLFNSMLVDTVVAALAFSVSLIIIFYGQNLNRMLQLSIPGLCYLVMVKNSGIVFVIICVGIIFVISCKEVKEQSLPKKTIIYTSGISACLPAFVLFLWEQHVKYVFPDGAASNHNTSIENYTKILEGKTTEDIKNILTAFADRFFSFGIEWIVILVCVGCVILCCIGAAKNKKNQLNGVFLIASIVVIYLFFMFILAVMYIISMPLGEALILASYSRYVKTILQYLLALTLSYILFSFNEIYRYKRLLSVMMIILVLIPGIKEKDQFIELISDQTDFENVPRGKLLNIKNKYNLPDGASYAFYQNNIDNYWYTYFLIKYDLQSTNIMGFDSGTLEENSDYVETFDYIIVFDEDETIDKWLTERQISVNEQAYKLSLQ